MPRLLVCLARLCIIIAVATGCNGHGASSPPPRSPQSPSAAPTLVLDRGAVTFSKADIRRLRQVFLADRSYLVRRGFKDASRIQLRLLSGSATFYCSPVEITYGARGPGPDYCQPTPGAPVGTVVLNARFLSNDVPNLLTAGPQHLTAAQLHSTELGAAAAVLGHELGHAEQGLRRGHRAPLEGVAIELQADCYAGQMVAGAEPRLLASAMRFARRIPGDSRHGSAHQRLAAFEHGAHGGKCAAR